MFVGNYQYLVYHVVAVMTYLWFTVQSKKSHMKKLKSKFDDCLKTNEYLAVKNITIGFTSRTSCHQTSKFI